MRARTLLIMAITAMLVMAIPAASFAGDKRSGPMRDLSTFDVIPGTNVRVNATGDKAHINVHTRGVTKGNAYTLWSFSFSNPGACRHGNPAAGLLCGMGDDGPGPQGFAVQYVAGHIAGNGGKLNFGGSIPVEDAADAEYHIVVADHGAKDPSQLPEQIKTPGPGVQIGFILP